MRRSRCTWESKEHGVSKKHSSLETWGLRHPSSTLFCSAVTHFPSCKYSSLPTQGFACPTFLANQLVFKTESHKCRKCSSSAGRRYQLSHNGLSPPTSLVRKPHAAQSTWRSQEETCPRPIQADSIQSSHRVSSPIQLSIQGCGSGGRPYNLETSTQVCVCGLLTLIEHKAPCTQGLLS